MALIKCPHCKALVTDSSNVCQVCGQPLPVSDETAIHTETPGQTVPVLTESAAEPETSLPEEEMPAKAAEIIAETNENTEPDPADPGEEIEITQNVTSPDTNDVIVPSVQSAKADSLIPEKEPEQIVPDEKPEPGAPETDGETEQPEETVPEVSGETIQEEAKEAIPQQASSQETAPEGSEELSAAEEEPDTEEDDEDDEIITEDSDENDEVITEDSDEDDEIIAEDTDPGTFSEDIAKILAAVGLETKSSPGNSAQDDSELSVKTIAEMVNPDTAEDTDQPEPSATAEKAQDESVSAESAAKTQTVNMQQDAVTENSASKAGPAPSAPSSAAPEPAPAPAPSQTVETPKPEVQKTGPAAEKESIPSEPKPSIKDKGQQITKSPMLKWIGVVAAIIAIAVIAVFAAFEISKMRLYSAAAKAFDEGSYDVAEEGFASLGDYKDSPDRLLDCRYQSAEKLLSEGKYEEATNIFDALAETGDGGYKDSADKSKESTYLLAKEHYDKGEYATAGKLFSTLGDYKDSAALSEDSDYQLSPDGAFLREMAAGLTERWKQKEADDTDPNYDEAVAFERLCDIELKHLEPFEEEEFDNTALGEDALAYIGLLREAKEAVSYMEDDYDRYVNIWNDAYADRTKLLQKFVADYGLKVDDNYKGLLESAIKDAGASVIAVDSNEEVKKMASTFRLTMETDDDGNSKHVLHMENTSPYTFDYFAVNVSVIDSDGNTLDAGSSDELSPWEKGERADLTVWLDGNLDPTQYTVKVEPQYYISEDSVDE